MSYADKKWAKLADEQQFDQLKTVHATAGKWRDGLIAVTSLFAVVTILKGPEKASELSTSGKILTAVFIGVAFACLLFASGLAMYAAYGFPSSDVLLTGENLKKWTASEAKTARTCLMIAAELFFVAFIALGVAIAVTWFDEDWFPPDPPALIYVERTPAQGTARSPVCGELKMGDATHLVVEMKKTTGMETTPVPYADVKAMKIVDECPD